MTVAFSEGDYSTRRRNALLVALAAALLAAACALTACSAAGQSFSIEGKWKNTGTGTYAMVQQGTVVTFDGSHCNVMSPSDTYAFSGSSGSYKLDVSAVLGGNQTFNVNVKDNDDIELIAGSTTLQLQRVG